MYICINRYNVLAQCQHYYRYIIIQNLCGARIPLIREKSILFNFERQT